MSGLDSFARAHGLTAARFTAIGRSATRSSAISTENAPRVPDERVVLDTGQVSDLLRDQFPACAGLTP
jgi:hypothetical protein